ncbi:MAG TPA: gamma-glutamylcyclotransferase family protein [Terriglobales bacterium]|jgi:gamma-glutamylcyclotransferase (GGCT)/AIG2-like uncharacterized protein YtfP|nr:gamma-glutamylcyclotransferase family protein [Terriglobales bacterium]
MVEYLFVYGTLRPEHAPPEIAAIVRQLRHVGSGAIRGFLYDLGEYPGVRLAADGNEIHGEVFGFDSPSVFESLDAYEGYDPKNLDQSLFLRKQCEVRLKDETLLCWVYEYNRQLPSSQRIDAWPPGKKST